MQPRLVAWQGDPGASYTYSGLTLEPAPWSGAVAAIRDLVWEAIEGAAPAFAAGREPFNGVLCNRYRDGSDSMGWHSDDEGELGPEPLIASVSLGAARPFQLRRKDDKSIKHEVLLENGSLLLMAGGTQRHWQHQLPKRKRVGDERVNLTFRWVRPNGHGTRPRAGSLR